MLESVLNWIDQNARLVVELQRLLVQIPALGPESGHQGEEEKAQALKIWMAQNGLPPALEINAPDARVASGQRPSLILRTEGQDNSRSLWILSHLDVVDAGDKTAWDTDPFTLHIDEDQDTLRGRGVEDNHQGIVAGLLLAKALTDLNIRPPFSLGLIMAAEEETGSHFGMEYLTKNHAALFQKDDLFIVPDFGAEDGRIIEIAEKGILWLKIIFTGRATHGSLPHKGINSLSAMATFIVKAQELSAVFKTQDSLFDPPVSTFVPTKVENNVASINILPGRDVVHFDCRLLPSVSIDDALAAFQSIGDEVKAQYGVQIDYEIVQRLDPAPITPRDAPVLLKLERALEQEGIKNPVLQGLGGGTMAAFIRKIGHPALVWSMIYDNPHTANERASIRLIQKTTRILARMLLA
ncbi:MAG: M20 family metallo-hydrolase [Alphaproteobacteria bacterium]|nr:M20 family metallo-hydrolase [Alphaproteobacteria bacterium]